MVFFLKYIDFISINVYTNNVKKCKGEKIMKRKSIIIASLFLFVILLTTKVNAADEACKISL